MNSRSPKKSPSLFALLFGAGLLLPACGAEPVESGPIVRPVKMLTIGADQALRELEYAGRISPSQRADMAFEVDGLIMEFNFDEGDLVAAGEVLARLDDRDYRARLTSEVAKRDKAKLDFERAVELKNEGVVAQASVDTAQRNLDVTQAAVDEAQKALEDTELVALFSGRLARKLVEDFQNVRMKETVLILQDVSTLEIKVDAPERDMIGGRSRELDKDEITDRIHPRVVITALPDRRFPARFKEMATLADPVTRTFEVTFAFDNPAFEEPPGPQIMPGMTAKLVIDVPADDTSSGISVPVQAVVADNDGGGYVWVVDTETMAVRRVTVRLGRLAGSGLEVLAGLEDGDTIAISGVHQLREGMAVTRYQRKVSR